MKIPSDSTARLSGTPQTTPRSGPTVQQEVTTRQKDTEQQPSIFDSIKTLLKPVIDLVSTILGINKADDIPYEQLLTDIKDKNTLFEKADYVRKKAEKVILHAQENISQGKNPWEGLILNDGITMSGKLQFLGGDDLRREIYYHNLAAHNWALTQLKRQDKSTIPGEEKIYSYVDLDNTTSSKPDPADTVFYQSQEKQFWLLKQILEANEILDIHEFGNTARTGLVTNKTSLVPEALVKTRTHGSLPSYYLERGGYTLQTQFDNSEKLSIIGLNGTIRHERKKKTVTEPELIEGILLYQLASSPGAPEIRGKNFVESILDLITKEGYAIFEPKELPRFVIDSQLSIDKFYFPHYQKIVLLKQEHVDKKLEALKNKGIEITDKEIKEAWINFKNALQDEEKSWDKSCTILDKEKVWLPEHKDGKSSGASKLYNLLEEYLPEIKIPKSKAFGCVNYKELLEKNPQGFFDVLTHGAGVAFVAHYFNNHGTPIQGAPDKIVGLYEEFSQNPDFRRMLAALSCALNKAFDGKYSRRKFIDFAEKRSRKTYIDEGARAYLNYRINNYFEQHFTKNELDKFKTSDGTKIFNLDGELRFSEEFIQKASKEKNLAAYISWLQKVFRKSSESTSKVIPIIESFLPDKKKCEITQFDSDDINIRKTIAEENEPIFYPNEFFEINSKSPYTQGRTRYAGRRGIVDKRSPLNPDAQYYEEDQPNSLKKNALVTFQEVLDKNIVVHAAGDSEGDLDMIARALELGGFVDIVFNQFTDRKIFTEIIKQRLEYIKNVFKDEENDCYDNNYYQRCREKFGISALEIKDGKYHKVERFDQNGNTTLESKGYTEDELIKELEEKYRFKIVRNASPEARIRRQLEISGLLTGKNIEFNPRDLARAEEIYKRKQNGEIITDEEKKLLALYEYSVIRKFEGTRFPAEAPHFDIYVEWHGKDLQGDFTVYRSKKHGSKLVVDRNDGTELKLYDKDEKSLESLHKVEISLNNYGDYIYLNENNIEVPYTRGLEKLNDHEIGNKLLPRPSAPSGIFASKLLVKILGEKNLKWLVCNMPNMFQGLLKYSGLVMGAGGLVRLLSPLGFGAKDSIYKAGYLMSNSVRAISACGGALRGILNVNRYWNIAIGEFLNVIASFLKDGSKHAVLGLGNFVLFLGRGQQAAQRRQRVNDHPETLLKAKPQELKELLKNKKYIDPRTYVRKVTEFSTNLITNVREEVIHKGIGSLIGEIAGSVLSAVVTPLLMIKDIVKDPRLILQIVKRQSEKSGGLYRAVPSPGHLMTLVGALSGIGAIISGTIGRAAKFGEVAESGFNKIGRWAISAACGIPALGIIANAKEIMANPDGLPKLYNGLNGKDAAYNPKAAGMLQLIAGLGFAITSLFDLSKKYAAPLYDISNMLYFAGASHEEGPNMHKTSLSELRASNKLYEPEPEYSSRKVDFSNAA